MNTQTSTQFLITFCIMPTILSALGSTGILLQWDVGCLSSTKSGTVNPLLTAGPPPPLETAKERIQMLKLALSDTKYHVEIKCQVDATDDFYCRSYCLLDMFRASNKICNKNHLLHLVGILFPHIKDDTWSKPHQTKYQISTCTEH